MPMITFTCPLSPDPGAPVVTVEASVLRLTPSQVTLIAVKQGDTEITLTAEEHVYLKERAIDLVGASTSFGAQPELGAGS